MRRIWEFALVAAVIVATSASVPCAAAPRLDRQEAMPDGTVIIPDTTEAGVYYYVPQNVVVASTGDRPQFLLVKFMDVDAASGETDTAGVVSLTLRFPEPPLVAEELWRSTKASSASFRPLPARSAQLRLIMTKVDGDGSSRREVGSLQAPWTEKTLAVRLNGPTATLLWDALGEPENFTLVADLELTTPGYVLTEKPGEQAEYEQTERVDRFSVPLRISRAEHPGLFRVVDRSQKISFRYRDLVVYCFDFGNQVITDLERVLVEVSVTNERGQRRTRTVVFTADEEPMQTISFDVPERRGQPYRYRVTRYLATGEQLVDDWQEGDAAHLDVSRYDIEVSPEG
jgi:hypothetical protein